MSRSILTGLAAAGLMVAFSSSHADSYEGDTVVVTANRTEQPASEALARVSVIDRDDIERSQAPDLLELLRLEAGVDIARTGGPGGQTSVFLRGTNSNHVLVLIDGMRAAAAGSGAFTWEILDPALIERIEIVRGPRAARWGSDAIGGVIQIFTRRPDDLSARAAYGRYDDRSLSSAWGNEHIGISIAGRRVNGFSSQNERGFAFDPDNDGFDNLSLALQGRQDFGGGTWSWNARAADGDVEFDQGESDFLNYALRTEYRHPGGGDWQWGVSAGMYRDRLETDAGFGLSEAITRRVQTGVQAERRLGDSTQWLLGVDAWRESGISRSSWSEDRYNLGAWTGLQGRRERFDWEASLRLDEDEHYGSATTGNLAGGWRPHENWRLFASFGRAFRAPNFNQLFSPGFGGLFAGNPDLDPETSRTWELGADFTPVAGQRFSASLFDTRVHDLIAFAGEDFQAINVRKARIQGAELVHRYTGGNWRAESSVTWQDPEDRDTGNPLLRRAKTKGAVAVDYLFANNGWAGLELSYTGTRHDVGQVELPSYTLVNLRAGLPLPAGFRIEGRLENLTDRNYEPLVGFNAHRRSLFVALSWQG